MRVILAVLALLWAAPGWAQSGDGSLGCVAHQGQSQRGGANREARRYQGLDDWYSVQIINRCSQSVFAQICITTPTGTQQCNVLTLQPGRRDDYGFADYGGTGGRYRVVTCYVATAAAGRCGFQTPAVPRAAPQPAPSGPIIPPRAPAK